MTSKLLIVTLFAAYMLSVIAASIEYDSAASHHDVIEEDDDMNHRKLQATRPAYFNTASISVLGDRNYNASYGNPLKGLGATQWSPEMKIDHAIEYTYSPLYTVLTDFNTYDWTSFESILAGTASRNRQLVPRFFITYPPYESALPLSILKKIKLGPYTNFGNDPNTGLVPLSPIYDDPIILGVLQSFIAAFGAKYNGDKRIAYVQPGLLGFWGEYHTLQNPFIPQSARDNVTTWFKQAFPTTPMMVRYPSATTKKLNVGYHDDSFTWSTLDGAYDGDVNTRRMSYFWPMITNNNHSDSWRFSPIGGEARPENIPSALTQNFPRGTRNKQDFWACSQITHAVYMKYGYFSDDFSLKNGIFIHTNMGYNYQLRQVSAMTTTVANRIDVNVTVEQIGYSPFYYPLSIAFRCKGAILQTVPGVEKLIDQFQTGVFTFRNIAVDSTCLSSVQFTLESQSLLATRPMKWAQGMTGTVTLNIPLPPTGPTAATVPTPVAVVTAPRPVAVVVVAPAPIPVATVVVAPVPTPVATVVVAPVPTPVAAVVVVPPVPVPVSTNINDVRFFLVNADTNKDFREIADGNQRSVAGLGTKNMSIRVEVPIATKSMTFSWIEDNGTRISRDEGTAPYYMGGNSGTDVFAVGYLSTLGWKTVTVTCKDLNGVAFHTETLRLGLNA